MTFYTSGGVSLSSSSFSLTPDGHGGALVSIHTEANEKRKEAVLF